MDVQTRKKLNDQAVENFRRYLRIPSAHPNINYDDCIAFIKEQAEEIGLSWTIHEFVKGKPIVILKWEGTDSTLPSILLNSHMDVVPVFPEFWSHDPFGAEMDEAGNIYARGAQDMKCNSIQYLEAIRRLKLNGQRSKRTVFLSFVPDEEIGGADGMEIFVTKQEFKDLNIGFVLDEGSTSETEKFELYNGEKNNLALAFEKLQIEFKVTGTGDGHGSLMLKDTPGEKLRKLLDKVMDYRQNQINILEANPDLKIGDVTTINLTILQGGLEVNVVPPEFKVSIDIRLALDVDLDQFEQQLHKWCDESGGGIEINFIWKDERVEPTKLDDSNLFWLAMKKEADDMGLILDCLIMAGGTDSQFIRKVGIPAISFSPINKTISRIHANDEYLNKDIFLKGIEIYERIILGVANV